MTKGFFDIDFRSMCLIYVWGHSYEFDVDGNCERIEEFCRLDSNNTSIWYAANIEIIDYLKALDNLKYSADCEIVYNLTAISVWISADENVIEVKLSEVVQLNKTSEK